MEPNTFCDKALQSGLTSAIGIPDYSNKLILAPMVRVGKLPFRLLALEQGADIVYSEEIIALKLQKTKRVVNELYQTVDFIAPSGEKVFRTNFQDQPNVLQLGAGDSVSALNAATIVSQDVNGIDLNMGCPKHFSIQGGMGASLLKKPEIVKDILSTLKRNLNNSITCKIRLLDTVQETIDLLRVIEQTGVSAIGIHARYVPQRPREAAHWNLIPQLKSSVNVPLIINGDVWKHEDIERVKKETGISSVMIARGAIENCSIFNPSKASRDDMIRSYIKKCIDTGNLFSNIKHVVLDMMCRTHPTSRVRHPLMEQMQRVKEMSVLCDLWELGDYYKNARTIHEKKNLQEQQQTKKLKTENC